MFDCNGRVNNLIENMEYQFRVIAVNKAGNSEPSEPTKTLVAKPRFRNIQNNRNKNISYHLFIDLIRGVIHAVDRGICPLYCSGFFVNFRDFFRDFMDF